MLLCNLPWGCKNAELRDFYSDSCIEPYLLQNSCVLVLIGVIIHVHIMERMVEHSLWKLELGLYKGNTWANTKCIVGQDSLMSNSCSDVEKSFVCSMWQPSVRCLVSKPVKNLTNFSVSLSLVILDGKVWAE